MSSTELVRPTQKVSWNSLFSIVYGSRAGRELASVSPNNDKRDVIIVWVSNPDPFKNINEIRAWLSVISASQY
jgi:hypothetical protein